MALYSYFNAINPAFFCRFQQVFSFSFFLRFLGGFFCGRGDAANQGARLKAEKMGGEKFQENFAGVFLPPLPHLLQSCS